MTYWAIYTFDPPLGEWLIGDIFNRKQDAIAANGGVEQKDPVAHGVIVEISRERMVKDFIAQHLLLLPELALERLAEIKRRSA